MKGSKFFEAYMEAADFTERPDDIEERGAWDAAGGWAESALASAADDCTAFLLVCGELSLGEAQAGHDFWLTRNRHGAGFWEREWGDDGERLTRLAHSFGETSAYVGDDGYIHFER